MKRFDERDIIFARMAYKTGSLEYNDYYRRNPDKKAVDDMLRDSLDLFGSGTRNYDSINSPLGEATFRFLSDIKNYSEGKINQKKVLTDPAVMTKKLKGLAKYYGADLVGIAKMSEYMYYSHRGRNAQTYGKEITNFHKYGIVFAVEMDRGMIIRAPLIGESIEVTKGYVNAAVIGMIISYYIRELGYEARNNMDGNYLVVAPLVAQAAGLGEIGRSGILVTKKYGPRVRLGVVTTDIKLIPDDREDFGLIEFCNRCSKCAKACPANAIMDSTVQVNDDDTRWIINAEKCFGVWKKFGTDCGVCMAACPFSQELDTEIISAMKGNEKAIEGLLQEFEERCKGRYFNNKAHEWL